MNTVLGYMPIEYIIWRVREPFSFRGLFRKWLSSSSLAGAIDIMVPLLANFPQNGTFMLHGTKTGESSAETGTFPKMEPSQ